MKIILNKYKSVLESFFSLSILNGLNVVLPLVTLPYILRVVGAANYGVYSYVYVLIQYIVLLNTYGFNYSATKQIAENRDDQTKINSIYNSVIACRLILFLGVTFLFIAMFPFLFETRDEKIMFLMGLGVVLGDTFNPIWFFQGMEKMRFITIVNVLSKLLFTVLIFLFIVESDDYFYLIIFNSGGFLLAGLLSVIIVRRKFGIKFHIPVLKDIIFQFKEGWVLFGSTIGTTLYKNANVFILKFFVSESSLGIYAAAEKIIKGFQMLANPIAQALFPYLSHNFHNNTTKNNLLTLKKLVLPLSFFFSLLSAVPFIFSDIIVEFFGGNEYLDASVVVKIMSPIILFGGLNYLFGVVGLVNLKKQTYFFRAVLISGLISVLFVFVTVKFFGINSAALAMLLAEIVLCILCVIKLVSEYRVKL
jgi:PST family polysaccharide transporter